MTKTTNNELTLDELIKRLEQLPQLPAMNIRELFNLRGYCCTALKAIEQRIIEGYELLDTLIALYANAKLLAEQEKRNKNLPLDEIVERLDQLRQLAASNLHELFDLRTDLLCTLETSEHRISEDYGLLDKVTALYANVKLLAEQKGKNEN